MNLLQIINIVVVSVGIPVIIGWLVSVGRKLQVLDDLKETTERMKYNVKIVSDFLIKNANSFDPSELRSNSPTIEKNS